MSNKIDFDFKQWILDHNDDRYKIILVNDKCIELDTEYGKASINATDIEDSTIIEFNIISNKDGDNKFYLHFELNDEEHAKGLYDEMVEALVKLKDEKTVKVLLSCSAGLTTSMFAANLSDVSSMLGLDYSFEAVPYMNIFEVAEQYDIVLIAPQIGYVLNKLKDSITDKPVLQIPTALFASYNAMDTIKFIQKEVEKFHKEKEKEINKECTCCAKHKKRILSIVIRLTNHISRISYRLYDKGEIIDSNVIIKSIMNIYDLYDIIDTVLLKHSYIDIIGIATPGIVNDEKQLRDPHSQNLIDVKLEFENKYGIKVFVYNNANAAVVGFALEHPEFSNIVYHSQPYDSGVGGQSIYINGKVVRGKNGIAGELRYFIRRMQLSDDVSKLAHSQRGTLEIVTKSLLPTLIAVGPEAVAISSPMTPDMNEVKNSLSSFIDREFLPEFYFIKDPSSYMLSGITSLCIDYIS